MKATVVLIECERVCFYAREVKRDITEIAKTDWCPQEFCLDPTGKRFSEELLRRLLDFWKMNKIKNELTLLSLPGTILNNKSLLVSSRIGISEKIDIGNIIQSKTQIACFLFHDLECISKGELFYGDYSIEDKNKCCIYILVDEGVGAKIMLNGKFYTGSGTAGSISRLVVHERGKYYPKFKSEGVLEAYVSHPMISKNLVDAFESVNTRIVEEIEATTSSKFIQALKTALSVNNRGSLSYQRINQGVSEGYNFAIDVIDDAARHFGFAIHTLITTLNPETIIIGGKVMTEIERFRDKSIEHAKKLTWSKAWQATKIHISNNGEEMQILGTIHLYQQLEE